MKRVLPLLFITLISFQPMAQTVADQRCAAFGKGMNLSNWLEAPWQTNWPTATGYTKADLELMKVAGIQSIRLPVCFAHIIDTVAPYYIDTNHLVFARIDSVIKWTAELQMNLIIDNHHEWTLSDSRWRNNLERFGHLWSVLASRYKYLDPEHYSFELLNEPPIFFALDSLNIIFNDAIDSIRQHTTTHSIIVSPNNGSWGRAFTTTYIPLADSNLIYTWHCYDPLNFTHQGFSWATPSFPTGMAFSSSTNWMESWLYDGINEINHWRDTFNKPIFLGEFGVGEHADDESRCQWISFMGHYLDSANINWFYWDWRWDFTMFHSHVISADSVLSCFSHALHLYGDTLISTSTPEIKMSAGDIQFYPTLISKGTTCVIKTEGVPQFNVKVFDCAGRLMLQQKFNQPEGRLPLYLEKGMYFVQITAGEQSVVKKLISD